MTTRTPLQWVPTLYFVQGMQFFVVMLIAGLMFKSLGVSNELIARWTGVLALAWAFKPLWSPFLELARSKKRVVVVTQVVGALCLGLMAVALQLPAWFGAALVVLFLIALRMIFPPDAGPPTDLPGEPLIVPLAIPALAGPSAMATVMLLVAQAPERKMEWVAALCVTMAVCAVVLLLAERIQRLVGERVVMAFERLMGLILVAISVEMLIRGIKQLAHQL